VFERMNWKKWLRKGGSGGCFSPHACSHLNI